MLHPIKSERERERTKSVMHAQQTSQVKLKIRFIFAQCEHLCEQNLFQCKIHSNAKVAIFNEFCIENFSMNLQKQLQVVN